MSINKGSGFGGVYKKQLSCFINPKADSMRLYCDALDPYSQERCFNGVVYFDVKGFKAINDNFSEAAGDVFLSYIMDYIQYKMNLTPNSFVIRKGGDEVLLYNMIMPKKDKCKATLGYNPYELNDVELEGKLEEFCKNEITLYVPNNSTVEYMIRQQDCNEFESEMDKLDPRKFAFRILIKGFRLRFAIGYDEIDAANKAQLKKERETENRGEFSKSVLINFEKNNKKDGEWISLAEYAIIVVKPVTNYIATEKQRDKQLYHNLFDLFAQEYKNKREIKSKEDDFGLVYFIAISKEAGESRKALIKEIKELLNSNKKIFSQEELGRICTLFNEADGLKKMV